MTNWRYVPVEEFQEEPVSSDLQIVLYPVFHDVWETWGWNWCVRRWDTNGHHWTRKYKSDIFYEYPSEATEKAHLWISKMDAGMMHITFLTREVTDA